MTKVVLSDNVEKGLDITLKLWYLQQKYGEIYAFVYLYKADMWVKIHDPFIILPDDRSYIRYFTDNDMYSKISACSGYSWFYNEGIDMNLLDLKHLRFDEYFIRIVEIYKNTKECSHLRIEEFDGVKENINIITNNGKEFIESKNVNERIRVIDKTKALSQRFRLEYLKTKYNLIYIYAYTKVRNIYGSKSYSYIQVLNPYSISEATSDVIYFSKNFGDYIESCVDLDSLNEYRIYPNKLKFDEIKFNPIAIELVRSGIDSNLFVTEG